MTIECYVGMCPYHGTHTMPDDGPFCYEAGCRLTGAEQAEFYALQYHDKMLTFDKPEPNTK